MTKGNWQLQEAKNRFSEVVELAMKEGAQTVTKHGRPAQYFVRAFVLQKAEGLKADKTRIH